MLTPSSFLFSSFFFFFFFFFPINFQISLTLPLVVGCVGFRFQTGEPKTSLATLEAIYYFCREFDARQNRIASSAAASASTSASTATSAPSTSTPPTSSAAADTKHSADSLLEVEYNGM
jgi:hypothetical protein